MSILRKLFAILQAGEGHGFYANSAVHLWSAAFITHVALSLGLAWWLAGLLWLIWATVKEFIFDMHWEVPPQSFGSIKGPGALNDFVAYLIGYVIGLAAWVV